MVSPALEHLADNDSIVLPPIHTENLVAADVEDLTRNTRELMLKEMFAMSERKHGVSMPAQQGSTGATGIDKAM